MATSGGSTSGGGAGGSTITDNRYVAGQALVVRAISQDDAAAGYALPVISIPELMDGAGNFVRQRGPVIFKVGIATGLGSTAFWTPAAGKKFRLMRYKVVITSNASLAAGGFLVVDLLDAAASTAQTHSQFVPTAAITTGAPPIYDSGWIDLGNGVLSAVANNVLNINLSVALATGQVRVIACGTEE